jgi:hypothetical protein
MGTFADMFDLQHATMHFRKTAHPIIKSFEPGEDWVWCNIDEIFLP